MWNISWGSDSWCGTHLRENFRNLRSRDKISFTVEWSTLKCIPILCALANGNFSKRCPHSSSKIEGGWSGSGFIETGNIARIESRKPARDLVLWICIRTKRICELRLNLSGAPAVQREIRENYSLLRFLHEWGITYLKHRYAKRTECASANADPTKISEGD
jgi:hypothetical protein